MSFSRLHKLITYVFAGLGLFALSLGPYLDLLTELLLLSGFVASAFVEGKRIRSRRWIGSWTIGLVGFAGVQVLRGLLGGAVLTLVLEFTAVLQLSRLFNRRSAKEHQQIAAIAILHLIAATILSTELSYAIAFAGFLITTPWMLALGHLRSEIETAYPADGEGEHDLAAVDKALSQKLVGGGFLLSTAALAIPLFVMTGLVFVAFPRVGLGFLSFGRGMGQQVSGFGANVELGDFGVIRTDPTVVLRITPPDLPEDPPLERSLRMRGTSFDHYDGRRWTRTRDTSEGIGRVGSHYAIPLRLPNPYRDRAYEIVLDGLEEPVLFLPPNTVGLRIPPRVVGGVDVGREITLAPGTDIRYADADGLGLRYTAYTSERASESESLSAEMRRRYLQLPPNHERVGALAREWTEGATHDVARVERLLLRLRDSGQFSYSLEMPEVGPRQPLDVFLFEARRGHCEYFATALATMLRTLGIPARNVTGFLGGRWNDYGGYYAISQGDAHSWVEARVDGRWVTLDPTPPGRSNFAPDPGWLGTLRELTDALRTRWSEHVVSYDLRRQIRLFWRMRQWFRGSAAPAEPGTSEATGASPTEPRSRSPLWLLLAAGLLAGLALYAWRRWRRSGATPEALADPSERRAVELLTLLDAKLTELGRPRPPHRTPHEHAHALAQARFRSAHLVEEVVGRYTEARFGAGSLDEAELERWRRAISALRQETGPA